MSVSWSELVVKHTNNGACNFQAAADELVRERDAEIERLRNERAVTETRFAMYGELLSEKEVEIERLRDSVCRITEQAATYSAEIERLREQVRYEQERNANNVAIADAEIERLRKALLQIAALAEYGTTGAGKCHSDGLSAKQATSLRLATSTIAREALGE